MAKCHQDCFQYYLSKTQNFLIELLHALYHEMSLQPSSQQCSAGANRVLLYNNYWLQNCINRTLVNGTK